MPFVYNFNQRKRKLKTPEQAQNESRITKRTFSARNSETSLATCPALGTPSQGVPRPVRAL